MTDIVTKTLAQDASEPSQLITLKPEKYVAEVFAPFKKQLTKAIKDATGVTYDITTTAGMKAATELRATFRTIRTDAEKQRKERKAPIIEIGKLLDTRYKALEAEIEPHEDKYDADIKAENQRKEDEKLRKMAEERARVEAIENRIQNIRNVPVQMLNEKSASIKAMIDEISNRVLIASEFEEYLEDAIAAVNATLVELEKMRANAADREAAVAQAEAERRELARLREEAIKRDQDEAARRKAEEDARRLQQAAQEAEMQALRDQVEAERKAMEQERARMAKERAELELEKNPPPPVLPISSFGENNIIDAKIADESVVLKSYEPKEEQQRPSDDLIVNAVADTFEVSIKTALQWIKEIEFDEFVIF